MNESIKVIDRVFDILEILAYEQKAMPLKNIVAKVGISKTTVHRLLQDMLTRGYVDKNLDNQYVLGAKYIELASYYIDSLELQSEAKPYLSLLYSEVNLSVTLGVLENNKLNYITKLDQYPTGKNFAKRGYTTPAYCSSIGKTLLASLPGHKLQSYINQCNFEKYTANTITNKEQLIDHLRKVRTEGFAIDDEESQLDHRCVAVPIYDYAGNTIASVGVSGNKQQLNDDKIYSIIDNVRKIASEISKRMGYIV